MRNLAEFNAQMNDPESDYYSKFELSDRMGMLEDTANNFRSMVKSLDESELASEMKVDEETVKKYKEDIIKDFDKKLANYKKLLLLLRLLLLRLHLIFIDLMLLMLCLRGWMQRIWQWKHQMILLIM